MPDLDIEGLRERWMALFGRPAPKSFRRNLLIRGVAYLMQVQVYGGLSEKIKRRLREIAAAVRNGNTYKSLSAIAKAITGTNWNGFTFFGIKRRPTTNKNASGPRKVRRARP